MGGGSWRRDSVVGVLRAGEGTSASNCKTRMLLRSGWSVSADADVTLCAYSTMIVTFFPLGAAAELPSIPTSPKLKPTLSCSSGGSDSISRMLGPLVQQ